MGYIAKSLPVSWGCDTSEVLDASQAKTLVSAGFKWIVRTLSCSASELEALTAAGLGVMLYQASRASGWSAATGQSDGAAAAKSALAIGYPNSCSLWIDLSPGPTADLEAYVNAWASAAITQGMKAGSIGLYCEPGVGLSGEQLYGLAVTRYWRTGGMCPNVATRGYQMMQSWPGDLVVAPGLVVDADATWSDYLGSHPVAAFAA